MPTYNFIDDFLTLHSGTECHRSYLRWAAVSALGTVSGPRYRLLNGSYYIYPLFYVIFVGPQGSRKSYGMTRARFLIEEAFPDYPFCPDVTTRDDINRTMSKDGLERGFLGPDGRDVYTPLAVYPSEFKDLVSYNPSMMINFFTNIYDYVDRIYKGSTIKRGAEPITHPYLSILACENTDWFLRRLQEGIVTGGFSRRFNVVYEPTKAEKPVPRIILPADAKEITKRLVTHLKLIQSRFAEFKWTPDGMAFFDRWYVENFNRQSDDASIEGFRSTLDQQLLKLCMALELADPNTKYLITRERLEECLLWYKALEPNLIKLYGAGGRNELAVEHAKLIELINSRGGFAEEKSILRLTQMSMNPREQRDAIEHLTNTEQLVRKILKIPGDSKVARTWLITGEGMRKKEVLEAIRSFNIGT